VASLEGNATASKLFNLIYLCCILQVRLWGDRKQSPASVIVPYGGNSVDAVAFLPSPRGTDGHVLLTGVTRNTKTLFLVTGSVIGFAAVEYQSSEIEMFLH
jgi:hypothetical protein